MYCPNYCECDHCSLDKTCPSDHYGTGDAFCRDFSCSVINCARSECIDYEEQMSILYPDRY